MAKKKSARKKQAKGKGKRARKETRLCNDIGMNAITLPADAARAASVQRQLLDFVRRSVSDSLTRAHAAMQALTPERVFGFVTRVYEEAYAILQTTAEAEAENA